MAVTLFYEKEAPITPLEGKTIAVVGYGSQGHAHAQNMRDSGLNVIIAQREGSANYDLAKEHGFAPMPVADAVKQADLVILTLPDEVMADVYNDHIKDNLKAGATLGFTHGFNVHFKYIIAPEDSNVIMIAPKGPGHTVRSEYVKGGGVPCLVAIEKDPSGEAQAIGLAWANGIGGAKAGIILTTFKEETETDLFGEQAVLCGGVSALVKAGFETLVEAGYQPEIAYFECLHEVKLIVDLMYQGGISYMRYSISNTAEWGDLISGPRVVTDETKAEMKRILDDITSGKFAEGWMAEHKGGMKKFNELYQKDHDSEIEVVGRKLRKMMNWIDDK